MLMGEWVPTLRGGDLLRSRRHGLLRNAGAGEGRWHLRTGRPRVEVQGEGPAWQWAQGGGLVP